MNRYLLIRQLKRHEGRRLRPYRDTVGKLTIGYGRNLEDVGISKDEAEIMLGNDIDTVERLLAGVDGYDKLNAERQTVVANMAFNIGLMRLQGFRRMWAAIRRSDYDSAAFEMLDSKYARQVGARAVELAEIMRTGSIKDGL